MKKAGLLVGWCLIVFLLSSQDGTAGDTYNPSKIYGSTTHILQMYRVWDPYDIADKRFQLPYYQYLTLGSRDVGVKGLSIEVTGWGAAELFPPFIGDRIYGDLLYGYIQYQDVNRYITIRAGRQFLFTGASNNAVIDGIVARSELPYGFDISAYVGITTPKRWLSQASDYQYGGRLAWGFWDWGHIGISFAQEREQRFIARTIFGGDMSFVYLNWIDLRANVQWDYVAKNFQEAAVTLGFAFPWVEGFRIDLDYQHLNPFARLSKYSIFSVFTNSFDDHIGVTVDWRSLGWLRVSGYYRHYIVSQWGNGYEFGIEPKLVFNKAHNDYIAIAYNHLKETDNGYNEIRVFCNYAPIQHLNLGADVDVYLFESEVRGYKRAMVFSLHGGYEVYDNMHVIGEIGLSINPEYKQDLHGLVKFAYDFEINFGE